MIINPSEIEANYDRDGVVHIKSLLSTDRVETVRRELRRYIEENLATLPPEDYVLEADGESVRNLWRLDKHDAFFKALAEDPALHSLLAPLVNGVPEIMGVESFNKPALTGSPVPPHQDNAYFCLTPPDALTLWIALDPVTEGNGPVNYVRGSHKSGVMPHEKSGVAGNSMGLCSTPPPHKRFAPLLEPGDALIHHSQVIHYSAANTSPEPRCALLIVFKGAHCTKDATLQAEYDQA